MSTYKKGQWNAICDVCGFKFKSSKLKKTWEGLRVCEHDYETRHPQDFVRGKADTTHPAWTRTEPTDVYIAFVESGYVEDDYVN